MGWLALHGSATVSRVVVTLPSFIRAFAAVATAMLLGCGDSAPAGGSPPASASSAVVAIGSHSVPPGSASTGSQAGEPHADLELTPDGLFARGPATLVVGTAGDDLSDRSVRAQAELLRSLLPGATVVEDTSIEVGAGGASWPANPILFGGAHVNRVVAALEAGLPLRADASRIELGAERITEPGARLIAVVPSRAAGSWGPGHPTFLLYAGLGTPGIVEINGIRHGGEPILVGDAFGRLRTGRWVAARDGGVTAVLAEPAPRAAWRWLSREVAGVTMEVAFPRDAEASPEDDRVADAVARGLAVSAKRLQLGSPPSLKVYVHADRETKRRLTGDPGSGHAVPLARALHVLRADPSAGGPLERLAAHEGTHAFAGEAWGATGSALMGEGLAVWVAGGYGGKSLSEWSRASSARPKAASLLPLRAFRAKPEPETYPFAGLLVEAAIAKVGLDGVRNHLYGAGALDWDAACARAGTTAAELDQAVATAR